MLKELQLALPPDIALNTLELEAFLRKELAFPSQDLHFKILRKSIDARKKQVKINLSVLVADAPLPPSQTFRKNYPNVSASPQAIVVGAGPAGLFAALRLIELGIKPLVFERGKDVKTRRRDLAAINKAHTVNPDSNYCFGEGGAGTYSDGKLYTRSKKRGDVQRVLEILVAHGATDQVLVDAHPHIGTNKLPLVVASLRKSIQDAGGEIFFETRISDFLMTSNEIKGVCTAKGQEFEGLGVILATGHSARDIFELLDHKKIHIAPKPFAMGVRVEHTQAFVDRCQYGPGSRGQLSAAAYSLVAKTHFKGINRGVFSFCMCPGGFIVPASTAPGELVVNGMSPSRRDAQFANSGVVVAIDEPDWASFSHFGNLAALELQKAIEREVWTKMRHASGNQNTEHLQTAPAQRITEFISKKDPKVVNKTSYQPGIQAMDMNEVLPEFIAGPLREGLIQFGKKMKGYSSEGGQLVGLESRTSSPVRIPRDKESLEHISTKRLFPCGEGAGYAGGIVSAAIDGERCAEALAALYKTNR